MTAITSRSYTYGNTRLRIPRGARAAAEVFVAGTRLISRVLFAAPARTPMDAVSVRAREAASLREYASRMQATEPGFAADLYAAADRHELTQR